MISAMFACAVVLQQGSPTTPIIPPKQGSKVYGPFPVAKKHHRKIPAKKVAQKPVVIAPQFVDKPTGWGLPVATGDIVVIHFLVKKDNGVSLADSKKRGLPYTFKIGAAGNDPLLDMVVKGMKVGAVRTGTVSGKDAYGPAGALPLVSPKDNLLVTVTLLRRGDK